MRSLIFCVLVTLFRLYPKDFPKLSCKQCLQLISGRDQSNITIRGLYYVTWSVCGRDRSISNVNFWYEVTFIPFFLRLRVWRWTRRPEGNGRVDNLVEKHSKGKTCYFPDDDRIEYSFSSILTKRSNWVLGLRRVKIPYFASTSHLLFVWMKLPTINIRIRERSVNYKRER